MGQPSMYDATEKLLKRLSFHLQRLDAFRPKDRGGVDVAEHYEALQRELQQTLHQLTDVFLGLVQPQQAQRLHRNRLDAEVNEAFRKCIDEQGIVERVWREECLNRQQRAEAAARDTLKKMDQEQRVSSGVVQAQQLSAIRHDALDAFFLAERSRTEILMRSVSQLFHKLLEDEFDSIDKQARLELSQARVEERVHAPTTHHVTDPSLQAKIAHLQEAALLLSKPNADTQTIRHRISALLLSLQLQLLSSAEPMQSQLSPPAEEQRGGNRPADDSNDDEFQLDLNFESVGAAPVLLEQPYSSTQPPPPPPPMASDETQSGEKMLVKDDNKGRSSTIERPTVLQSAQRATTAAELPDDKSEESETSVMVEVAGEIAPLLQQQTDGVCLEQPMASPPPPPSPVKGSPIRSKETQKMSKAKTYAEGGKKKSDSVLSGEPKAKTAAERSVPPSVTSVSPKTRNGSGVARSTRISSPPASKSTRVRLPVRGGGAGVETRMPREPRPPLAAGKAKAAAVAAPVQHISFEAKMKNKERPPGLTWQGVVIDANAIDTPPPAITPLGIEDAQGKMETLPDTNELTVELPPPLHVCKKPPMPAYAADKWVQWTGGKPKDRETSARTQPGADHRPPTFRDSRAFTSTKPPPSGLGLRRARGKVQLTIVTDEKKGGSVKLLRRREKKYREDGSLKEQPQQHPPHRERVLPPTPNFAGNSTDQQKEEGGCDVSSVLLFRRVSSPQPSSRQAKEVVRWQSAHPATAATAAGTPAVPVPVPRQHVRPPIARPDGVQSAQPGRMVPPLSMPVPVPVRSPNAPRVQLRRSLSHSDGGKEGVLSIESAVMDEETMPSARKVHVLPPPHSPLLGSRGVQPPVIAKLTLTSPSPPCRPPLSPDPLPPRPPMMPHYHHPIPSPFPPHPSRPPFWALSKAPSAYVPLSEATPVTVAVAGGVSRQLTGAPDANRVVVPSGFLRDQIATQLEDCLNLTAVVYCAVVLLFLLVAA
ncbi:unnamed protein product [Vitrella brassicaformis CCMP3155]|uniref:Uncharacterized protein n=3 Tax=Vitrella brassicaformis TaxID=1169539 RepID=A0A0G4EVH8_VITBC|nr:unnamed protein product [Vitrella brassicaformis CCMP3155]|eukprot:CEM02417.1 unnamed protein product [Vitrella brassicaformis CCMP3155]